MQAEDLEMQIRDRGATVCVWGIFSMCRPLVDASLVCVDQLMEQNLDDLTSGLITCEALLLGHKTNLPSWASLSTFSSQQPPSNMRARAFAAWFLCSRFRSLGPCSRPRPPPWRMCPLAFSPKTPHRVLPHLPEPIHVSARAPRGCRVSHVCRHGKQWPKGILNKQKFEG